MSASTRIELFLLCEMVERARRIDADVDPSVQLARAFMRGIELLSGLLEGHPSTRSQTAEPLEEWRATRASLDLLRYRALLLLEQNDRLEAEIDRCATESRALQDALWDLHGQADRLKVKLGRRETIGERPEPPPTIGSGGSRKRRRGRAEGLLEGVELCGVEIEIPAAALERAEQLQRQPGWIEEWGAGASFAIVAHGLAALEIERRALTTADALTPLDTPALAALSYRVAELAESVRILELRETAFKIDNAGMGARLASLQQEVAELDQELAEHGARPVAPRRRGGVLGRLLKRRGG